MQLLEEVPRVEEIGDPIERLVIDQDRAEQGLLHLDVVRCGAKPGGFRQLLACD